MGLPVVVKKQGWIVAVLAAAGWIGWVAESHVARVQAVTNAVPVELRISAQSETGYAGGARRLVVPAPFTESMHWIRQTQASRADGPLRVHEIDYENAPYGHGVAMPAPYRAWLGFVAGLRDGPAGVAVEEAALRADFWWHLLLLAGLTALTACWFGPGRAAIMAAGLATLYPMVGYLAPGAPDDFGLTLSGVLLTVLPWVAPGGMTRGRALVSGVAGGFGVWCAASTMLPVLGGLGLGVLARAWWSRGADDRAALRGWGISGTVTVLLAYLLEFAPADLGAWDLRMVHPLHGLAWLGGTALLIALWPETGGGKGHGTRARMGWLLGGLVALAALPVAMAVTGSDGFLATELSSFRLAKAFDSPEGTSLFLATGGGAKLWAALLPGIWVLPGIWLLWRQRRSSGAVTVVMGPVVVALGMAVWQLSWFAVLDAVLLLVVIAIAGCDLAKPWRYGLAALGLATVLPGMGQLRARGPDAPLEPVEVEALIHRDLGYWLVDRTGGSDAPIVLTPPAMTAPVGFYSSVPGVATVARDNEEGLNAFVRILSASSPQEARVLLESRGITHLVLPSWDASLDHYTRMGTTRLDHSFLQAMRGWSQPDWLQAVPYTLPDVAGFENQAVTVFALGDEQPEALAMARLAIYFVDMNMAGHAVAITGALEQFPQDLAAWVARAEVAAAANDPAKLAECLRNLTGRIAAGGDRRLPWGLRVRLAVILMRAQETDAARRQAELCFADATESRLSGLAPAALYRLLVLGRLVDVGLADPELAELALSLLPTEWRQQFEN